MAISLVIIRMVEPEELSEEDLKRMSPEELLELQKQNCIFCKIAAKQIPSTEIYSDEHVLAILDINPATKGHVLIMPRQHYAILPQIPPDVLSTLFVTAQHISQGQLKGLQSEGTTIFVANGAAAGQRAPHFLLHVIPRQQKDGLFDVKTKELPERDLKQLRQIMKLQLGKVLPGNQLVIPEPIPSALQRAPAPQSPARQSPATSSSPAQESHETERKETEGEDEAAETDEEKFENDPARARAEEQDKQEEEQAEEQQQAQASRKQAEEEDQKEREEQDSKEKQDSGEGPDDPDDDDKNQEQGESSDEGRADAAGEPALSPEPPSSRSSSGKPDLDAIANLFTGGRR